MSEEIKCMPDKYDSPSFNERNMTKENTPFIITVIQDLANISSLVNSHTKDEAKTQTWLNSSHLLLNNEEPIQLVFKGDTEELKNFIEEQIKEGKL